MSRKRLTTATLQDRTRHASSEQAADLAFRLLGPAASDKELITAGATLHRNLGPEALAGIHTAASRIAQETGEDFPGPDENEGPPQPEPEETQNYVEEHVAAPDHVVLDTVVNKLSPTVDPTASSRQAADDDEDDAADMPDMEEPDDVEGGEEDYVEDESDEYEDMEDSGDMEDEDMEDPEEDYDESASDEPSLDDFMDDSDDTGDAGGDEPGLEGSTSADQGGSEEYYDDYPEDDREFSVSDLEALQDLGVEEVPGVMAGKQKRNGKRAASRQQQQFRPSRTRTASRGGGDEFEGVFGTPDLGDMFLH